jgi:hypothetical protein
VLARPSASSCMASERHVLAGLLDGLAERPAGRGRCSRRTRQARAATPQRSWRISRLA